MANGVDSKEFCDEFCSCASSAEMLCEFAELMPPEAISWLIRFCAFAPSEAMSAGLRLNMVNCDGGVDLPQEAVADLVHPHVQQDLWAAEAQALEHARNGFQHRFSPRIEMVELHLSTVMKRRLNSTRSRSTFPSVAIGLDLRQIKVRSDIRAKVRRFSAVSAANRISLLLSGDQKDLVTAVGRFHGGREVYVLDIEAHPLCGTELSKMAVMP